MTYRCVVDSAWIAMRNQKDWEMGGLVTESGALGRPLDLVPLFVPEYVWIDAAGSHLNWSWETGTRRSPDGHMLNAFTALAEAADEQIAAFARRYGPLTLCKHHLPLSHNSRSVDPDEELLMSEAFSTDEELDWDNLTKKSERCEALRSVEGHYWEPLSGWRRYAKEASAILAVAVGLNRDKLAEARDILVLEGEKNSREQHEKNEKTLAFWNALRLLSGPNIRRVENDPTWHRLIVRMHIQRWLDLGGVYPRFDWQDDETRRIQLHSNGLFGALALHLAIAVAQGKGIAFCSNCGQPYTPRRTPTANRRSYCDECRRAKAPARDAARAYRQHKKATQQ